MSALNLKVHPAAKLMPLMKGDEFDELVEDMRQHGQRHPVVMFAGMVLDGRNRLEACRRLKIEPKTVEWIAKGRSATAYVVSTNIARRHLTESQRATIAADLAPMFAAEAKQRQRAAGGDKRSPTATARSAKKEKGKRDRRPAAADAAKAVGASTRSTEAAIALKKADPKLFDAVKNDELTLKQATRQVTTTRLVAKAKAYLPPAGQFEVISTDWPWKYNDTQDGPGMDRGLPYPPMTIAEIVASIDELPVAENCALFAWVTNPILLDPACWAVVAAKLNARWGFVAKQIRTWIKTNETDEPVTRQGWVWRNDTEHLIRLERGRPVFLPTGENHGNPIQRTSFRAPQPPRHSEKPAVAYADIERICASSSRLEMYARDPRPGWITSGSELAKPPAPKMTEPPKLAAMIDGEIQVVTGDELRAKLAKKKAAQVRPLPLEPSLGRPLAEALHRGGITGPVHVRAETAAAGPDGKNNQGATDTPVALPPVGAGSLTTCPKCGQPVDVESDPYCAFCGARVDLPAGGATELAAALKVPRLCDERIRSGTCRCTSRTPCFAKQFADSSVGLRLARQNAGDAPHDALAEAVAARNMVTLAAVAPELVGTALAKDITPEPTAESLEQPKPEEVDF